MVDNLTPDQRSYCMSRVKNKDTDLERLVRSELHKLGLRFRKHIRDLPGKPDIVFSKAKVVVFIDGDFWHGYRFTLWKHKLSPFWKKKIAKNRERDRRNFAKLHRMGWQVIRVWKHTIKKDIDGVVARIRDSLENNN